MPGASNMKNTHTEKMRKYRELAEQMRRVTSVEIIPVILSSNGLVHKEVKNGLEKLELQERRVTRIQKSVIISSCAVL